MRGQNKMPDVFNIGDLVYIPSEVTIFNEKNTLKLTRPVNLLITGKRNGFYEVFYNSKTWKVEENNVYKTG